MPPLSPNVGYKRILVSSSIFHTFVSSSIFHVFSFMDKIIFSHTFVSSSIFYAFSFMEEVIFSKSHRLELGSPTWQIENSHNFDFQTKSEQSVPPFRPFTKCTKPITYWSLASQTNHFLLLAWLPLMPLHLHLASNSNSSIPGQRPSRVAHPSQITSGCPQWPCSGP